MLRLGILALTLGTWVSAAAGQLAEMTAIYDSKGTSESCTGFGPLAMPLVKKCVAMMQAQGLIREEELGVTGMTLGMSGKEDGVVVKVEPGSAAEQAGLAVGDSIVSIEDKPVHRRRERL